MKTRIFHACNTPVSEIGLGCWQLGAQWGNVPQEDALKILATAAELGITFFDTADVYGGGRSESLIGQFLRAEGCRDRIFIASKLGRFSTPGWPANFSLAAMRAHTVASLQRLGIDQLDLTQLHCIPMETMKNGGVFDHLRQLQSEGLIRTFGASVESMDEALGVLDEPGLASLQIIFNIVRQKPAEVLFARAAEKGVSLIVRLPVASGLLAGKWSRSTTFAADDHRNFNRDGAAFNVGETFAGLPFEKGLEIVDILRPFVPEGWTMAQWAQRWILDHPAVTTVITGASRPGQVVDNAHVSQLPPLSSEMHARLAALYRAEVLPHIRGPY